MASNEQQFEMSSGVVTMVIFVRNFNGKLLSFHVQPSDSSDTILTVKEKIMAIENVPINNQRLIFGGCKLEDDITIPEYNTHNEATLDLTGRLLSCVKCPDSSNHHYKH